MSTVVKIPQSSELNQNNGLQTEHLENQCPKDGLRRRPYEHLKALFREEPEGCGLYEATKEGISRYSKHSTVVNKVERQGIGKRVLDLVTWKPLS